MTQSAAYRAPFAPGGDSPIDADLCGRLLSVALSKGGEYADIFFEYRAGGGFAFDEGILKAASRGVTMGVGIRGPRRNPAGLAAGLDKNGDHIDGLATRVVIPLRHEEMFGPCALRLNPRLQVDGLKLVLDTATLGAVPCAVLRQPVAHLTGDQDAVTDALDALFGAY